VFRAAGACQQASARTYNAVVTGRITDAEGKVADEVLGGSSALATFSIVGGLPFNVNYTGHHPGNIDLFSGQPDLVSGCDPYANGHNVQGLWYNPACFAVPGPATLGNTPRNFLDSPSSWVVNFDPYSDIRLPFISELARTRISANIYNPFDHPPYNTPGGGVWGVPSDDITSPNAGHILSTRCARAPADWSCTTGVRQMMIRAGFEF
jgi:hypothetical protein